MRQKLLFISLIVLSHFVSKGQTACFSTLDTIGCIPFTINVTPCGDTTKPTLYNYGDGSSLTSSESHTYTSSGIYTISQFVSNNPTIDTFTLENIIRAVDSEMPIFSTKSCMNNQLRLRCEDIGYDKYIIDFGDGSPFDTILANVDVVHTYADSLTKEVTVKGTYNFVNCGASSTVAVQPFTSLIPPRTTTLTNIDNTTLKFNFEGYSHLNYSYEIKKSSDDDIIVQDSFQVSNTDTMIENQITEPNIYTLTLKVFDFCGNSVSEAPYTTINLSSTAQNGENNLSWNNDQTLIQKYIIYRDELPIDTLTPTTINYKDLNVLCGKTYCYQIVGIHDNDSNPSFSNISCIKSINNIIPPALDRISSSFNNTNKLEVNWVNSAEIEVSQYIIQDFYNGLITEIPYTGVLPFQINHKIGHCYSAYYLDACENTSELSMDTTCPIELNVTKNLNQGYNLNYTTYKRFTNGLSNYKIEWFDSNFNLIKSKSNSTALNYIDEVTTDLPQRYLYRIQALPNSMNEISSNSKLILVKQLPLMLFPNAFTPNMDDINDTFFPVYNHIKEYNITVFNAWGKIVYTNTNINEVWDGTTNGVKQPIGSYQYQVTYKDLLEKEYQKTGTVKLIR